MGSGQLSMYIIVLYCIVLYCVLYCIDLAKRKTGAPVSNQYSVYGNNYASA